MSGYIVHKPVALKDVQAKFKRGITDVSQLADTYMAQRKYDGVSIVMKVAGNGIETLTRTGTRVKSLHHIEHFVGNLFRNRLNAGKGFVLFGEAWKPDTAQTTINGLVMRDAASPEIQLVVFDIVPLHEFEAGESQTPFSERYLNLHTTLRDVRTGDPIKVCETFNPGTYGDPQKFASELVQKGGYDGAILRDPNGLWRIGGGSTGEIIKVKDAATETHDLRVVGITYGKGKYANMVGGLQCTWRDGKKVTVSGMSDKQRKEWYENPELIIGQIVEVHALGETSGGMLREPRMKSIRTDKVKADYE